MSHCSCSSWDPSSGRRWISTGLFRMSQDYLFFFSLFWSHFSWSTRVRWRSQRAEWGFRWAAARCLSEGAAGGPQTAAPTPEEQQSPPPWAAHTHDTQHTHAHVISSTWQVYNTHLCVTQWIVFRLRETSLLRWRFFKYTVYPVCQRVFLLLPDSKLTLCQWE